MIYGLSDRLDERGRSEVIMMSQCSYCGSETVVRSAQDWCQGCQAWVISVPVIDLRDPAPVEVAG